MQELQRAVVLLFAVLLDKGVLSRDPVPPHEKSLMRELRALMALLTERSRATVRYELTERGKAALDRAKTAEDRVNADHP